MVKLRFHTIACALVMVHHASARPACATPQNVSKQPNQKVQASSSQLKTPNQEQLKATHPHSDAQFIERAIKTHVPAPGQFVQRRLRIWNTLKRNYAEKKDITQILRQYVQMNDCILRGTNWIMDDAGTYTRMRPLSLQCKELEDALGLSPIAAPIK
jgi:hypothetical protein